MSQDGQRPEEQSESMFEIDNHCFLCGELCNPNSQCCGICARSGALLRGVEYTWKGEYFSEGELRYNAKRLRDYLTFTNLDTCNISELLSYLGATIAWQQ